VVGNLIRPKEAEHFIAKGVLRDMDDYFETIEMVHKVLQHSCTQHCLEQLTLVVRLICTAN
jgi:hypothetical protein